MKRILSTVIVFSYLLVTSSLSYAQDSLNTKERSGKLSKPSMCIYLGRATPCSKFGSKDPYGSTAGFANPGYLCSFHFAKPLLRSKFGLAANIGYYNNPFDNSVLKVGTSDPHTYAYFKNEDYQETVAMAGLYFAVSKKRLCFDVNILAGVALCNYSTFSFTYGDSVTGKSQVTHSTPAINAAFAYSGSIGFSYALSRRNYFTHHFFISSKINYWNANAKFNTTVTDGVVSEPATAKRSYSVVGVALGIGYKF